MKKEFPMKATNPFRFRGPAEKEFLVGREKERKQLLSVLKNSQSALLYAPRRFGKTWLLQTIMNDSYRKGILPIYLDFFPLSSEIHFLESYTTSIAEACCKSTTQAQEFSTELLRFLGARVVLINKNQWTLQYNWDKTTDTIKTIARLVFSLPETIARKRNLKIGVIFDEFQEVNKLNGERWEKEMRTIFQHQRDVGYIFSGSKTHLLLNMFTDSRRAFYQSAAMFTLSDISSTEWEEYISKRFATTGIVLSKEVLGQILSLTNGHPYYTQQLCYFLWEAVKMRKKVTIDDIDHSFDESLTNEDAYFRQVWEELPLTQRKLLIAIAKEGGKHILSGDFLLGNSLGPVSSVQLAAKALTQQKGILDKIKDEYQFTDPFFRIWIRREIL